MSNVDVKKFEMLLNSLQIHSEETRGLVIGLFAFVTSLPQADDVDLNQVARKASQIAGPGTGSSRKGIDMALEVFRTRIPRN